MLAGFVVSGFLAALFTAGLATAAPAFAIDDPTRPDARVTHGPSCRPGGLVVEVQAGSTPYSVRLATTRQPAGEDEASLAAGQTVVLESGDVAWGETIDGRLEYTAQDGSGATFVDELENYSFTRPTQEDCAAITAPASSAPTDPATAGSSSSAPASPAGSPSAASASAGSPSAGSPSAGSPSAGSPSAGRVTAGALVVLRAGGFLPGERVTVLLHAGGAFLGSAVAADDGTIEAHIRIPAGTTIGTARLDLVGDRSAVVSSLDLRVAAAERLPVPHRTGALWPVLAAAVALVGSVGALVSVAGRSRAIRGQVVSSGSA
jgi:hypothetical protein